MDVDLIVLQERCRKDPQSYTEDFEMQKTHFLSLLDTARLQPSSASARLTDVASFMGAVAPYYKGTGSALGTPVVAVLAECAPTMNAPLRRALVRLLALLRARNSVQVKVVIPLFFRLLACEDKTLRRMLHGHIVSDLRRTQNTSGDANRRSLQSFLFSALEDPSETLVKRTLYVLVDLFRKGVWNDPRCANMIASACFHSSTPIAIIAARFLLDSNVREMDDDDTDSDMEDEPKRGHDGRKAADMWKAFSMTAKKSTKKRKRMEKVVARATRHKAAACNKGVVETDQASSAAMALLNDPQNYAEKLFKSLQNSRKKDKFETKLVFINLLTRIIGGNHLILFEVYTYLQKYLQPAQPQVTRVLAYLTQACHDIVPSDVLHPILKCIADRFVSDRSSPPSVAAGINTIRAICSRVPLAILDADNEYLPEDQQEAPLLEDLVQYKNDRDKGTGMAARSLISLYREIHPKLLHKKDRGRMAAEAVQKGNTAPAPEYAKLKYSTGVDGVELLADSESEEEEMDVDIEGEIVVDDVDGEDDNADTDTVEGGDATKESGENEREEENEIEEEDTKSDANENEETVDENDEDGGAPAKEAREDTVRLLTNADFAKIRAKRAARAVSSMNGTRVGSTGDSVDPVEIQGVIRRERKTLEERLEKVLAGREGRVEFGSKKGSNKGGGSTNTIKKKSKANAMVLHKRRRTNKLGRRERQIKTRRKRDYK